MALREPSLHSLELELLSLSESDSELLSDSLELPEVPDSAVRVGGTGRLWGREGDREGERERAVLDTHPTLSFCFIFNWSLVLSLTLPSAMQSL